MDKEKIKRYLLDFHDRKFNTINRKLLLKDLIDFNKLFLDDLS